LIQFLYSINHDDDNGDDDNDNRTHSEKNILWSTQAKKMRGIRCNENYLCDIVAFYNIFTPEEITVGWQDS
jgi:hypothetical protein